MSEMIERVRDALKASFASAVSDSAEKPFEATGVTMPGDHVWDRYARAAIEAMDVPTIAMIDAACAARIKLYPAFEGEKPQPTAGETVLTIWQAMRAAALNTNGD